MPVDLVRDAALDVILGVLERGAFISQAVDRKLRRRKMSPRGRRFFTQLVYGTVRHKDLCDHALIPLMKQPLNKLPRPIHNILRMGVYQSIFLNSVTPPAMVHTSVDLAKKRGHAGTARLVNAVLKRVPQDLGAIQLPNRDKDPIAYLAARYSTPKWLVEHWSEEWGEEQAGTICEVSCEQAPTTIRANLLRTSPDELRAALAKADVTAGSQTVVPEELTVAKGDALHTRAFKHGDFMLQDTASMLPAHLVEPQPGERILDLCAAPGTKTTHLAELAEDKAHIIAMDAQPRRLPLVHENLARLGITGVSVTAGDGGRPPFKGDFNRVLVDAPCSGLGTLRRHPDLKWHTKPEDIDRLADLQLRLLRSAVGLCENGGVIVYAVCTITKQETEEVVRQVIDQGSLAPEDGPEWMNPWQIATGMYRILPGTDNMDGFFLTRLRKSS